VSWESHHCSQRESAHLGVVVFGIHISCVRRFRKGFVGCGLRMQRTTQRVSGRRGSTRRCYINRRHSIDLCNRYYQHNDTTTDWIAKPFDSDSNREPCGYTLSASQGSTSDTRTRILEMGSPVAVQQMVRSSSVLGAGSARNAINQSCNTYFATTVCRTNLTRRASSQRFVR
jgi:hypothetical protein